MVPGGVIPALMMHAMRRMKREGIPHMSLCLIPGLNCDEPMENDSALLRRGLGVFWRHGSWLFDLQGIYHYKSRFRPEYHCLYVAAHPRVTWWSMRSSMMLWGVLRPDPAGLLTSIRDKRRKRKKRSKLAKPTRA